MAGCTKWSSVPFLHRIGTAAFDYQFNTLDEPNSPLVRAYSNELYIFSLFSYCAGYSDAPNCSFDVFDIPSNLGVLYMMIMDHLSCSVVSFNQNRFPVKRMACASETKDLSIELSKQLIAEKRRMRSEREPGPDEFAQYDSLL